MPFQYISHLLSTAATAEETSVRVLLHIKMLIESCEFPLLCVKMETILFNDAFKLQ